MPHVRHHKEHHEAHAVALTSTFVVALGFLALGYGVIAVPWQQQASTGVFASVPANEHNTLAQHLSDKERELLFREDVLRKREEELTTRFSQNRDDRELVVSVGIGAFLLMLILMNFILDARRARRMTRPSSS